MQRMTNNAYFTEKGENWHSGKNHMTVADSVFVAFYLSLLYFSDLTGHQRNPQTYNKLKWWHSWASLPVCLMINWMNTLLTSPNIRPAKSWKRARSRLVLLLPISVSASRGPAFRRYLLKGQMDQDQTWVQVVSVCDLIFHNILL